MKPVPEFEGLYSVTDDGRIYNHGRLTYGRNLTTRMIHPKWMAMRYDKNGYSVASLTKKDGTTKDIKIHQLVLELYGPPRPSPDHLPNHKNLIKSDNRIDNLEWMTQAENVQHAVYNGHHFSPFGDLKGERHYKAIVTEEIVRDIRRRYTRYDPVDGLTPLAKEYGISISAVKSIVDYQSWKHIS